MTLNEKQRQMAETSRWDFSDLKACFLNCTLKKHPEPSHTEGLMNVAKAVMEANGVTVELLRVTDYDLAPGVYPDMRAYGWERDDWPDLVYPKVMAADILVIGTPIWLGDKSSVCTRVIERLYSSSGNVNEQGQYDYYGRVGGCIVTGNDGGKHCGMNILYSLQHIGFLIPPQADAYWVGEAGPGPSYLDEGSGGPQNDFTQRNVTFMSWNLMHLARMLKDNGGIPAHGNQRTQWDAGCRFDHPNPEYR